MIGTPNIGSIIAWLIVLATLLFALCSFCIQYGNNMRLEEQLRRIRQRKGTR